MLARETKVNTEVKKKMTEMRPGYCRISSVAITEAAEVMLKDVFGSAV